MNKAIAIVGISFMLILIYMGWVVTTYKPEIIQNTTGPLPKKETRSDYELPELSEQEIAVTLETNESLSWYSRYASYGYASTAAMTQSSWNMMGIRMSTGKTTTARTGFRSKNGSSWVSAWTSRSTNAITPAGAIRVGTGYAGPVENGYINSVYCWTTMLSDAEVLAMYNHTKGKFGL